jgi:hypothetical protein
MMSQKCARLGQRGQSCNSSTEGLVLGNISYKIHLNHAKLGLSPGESVSSRVYPPGLSPPPLVIFLAPLCPL